MKAGNSQNVRDSSLLIKKLLILIQHLLFSQRDRCQSNRLLRYENLLVRPADPISDAV